MDQVNFGRCTFIDADLRNANYSVLKFEGANLIHAFGAGLNFTIERALKDGIDHYSSQELYSLYRLFTTSGVDENTQISGQVLECLRMFDQPNKPDQPV